MTSLITPSFLFVGSSPLIIPGGGSSPKELTDDTFITVWIELILKIKLIVEGGGGSPMVINLHAKPNVGLKIGRYKIIIG